MTNTTLHSLLNSLDVYNYRIAHNLKVETTAEEAKKITAEITEELENRRKENENEFTALPLVKRFELGGYEYETLKITADGAEIKTKKAEYIHPFYMSANVLNEFYNVLVSELESNKRKNKNVAEMISTATEGEIKISINNYDYTYLKYALINTNKKGFKVKEADKALSRMLHVHLTKGEYNISVAKS